MHTQTTRDAPFPVCGIPFPDRQFCSPTIKATALQGFSVLMDAGKDEAALGTEGVSLALLKLWTVELVDIVVR